MKFRLSDQRGMAKAGWLDSKHSFSFANYYDEEWMSFGSLRVLNEDWIAPRSGFPMHPHRNMEIVTVMLSGQLNHRDSMGNEQVLNAGEIQAMTTGTGILHSEWNGSSEPVHLYQLWIETRQKGLEPSYDQFKPESSDVQILASGYGNGLKINADAEVIKQKLSPNELWESDAGSQTYLHVIEGELEIGGMSLRAGDAIGFEQEKESLKSLKDSEILVIKMY